MVQREREGGSLGGRKVDSDYSSSSASAFSTVTSNVHVTSVRLIVAGLY
jgi:hypothetical protein